MSMNNKQRWMGGVVLLSGGVLLAALLLKGKEEIHQNQVQQPSAATVQPNKAEPVGAPVNLQPLTVDVATEKRLLEEQKRSREKAVAEQEAKAAEFLRMQQQAEAEAARKAAEEYAAANARRGAAAQEGADIPPELVQDDKAKAQQKAAEQKKLEQQNAQAKQKAEAEKKLAEQKRKATADEAEKREKATEKKAAEKKQKAQDEAKKKTEAEKARDLLENGDKQWMVQVALAANDANADAVAAKLRAKGYKVTRSKTSKGVRIMVGPSKDRETADATRKKINADESLGMKSAWVNEWTPLDKR